MTRREPLLKVKDFACAEFSFAPPLSGESSLDGESPRNTADLIAGVSSLILAELTVQQVESGTIVMDGPTRTSVAERYVEGSSYRNRNCVSFPDYPYGGNTANGGMALEAAREL